jgi:hypothetical protein
MPNPETIALNVKDPKLNRLFNTSTEEVSGPFSRISCRDQSNMRHKVCMAFNCAQEGPETQEVRVRGHSSGEDLKIACLDGDLFVIVVVKDTDSPAVALSRECDALC